MESQAYDSLKIREIRFHVLKTSAAQFSGEESKQKIVLLSHYSVILPYKGKRTHKICPRITLYNPGLSGFWLKEDEAKTKCSGHLTHCLHSPPPPPPTPPLRGARKNTTQPLKYPLVLSDKTPNKVF